MNCRDNERSVDDMKKPMLATVGLLYAVCAGCTSDVSTKFPHSELVGTVWKLKTDAYVVENNDEKGVYRVIPCVSDNYVYFPEWNWRYNEKNIGKKGDKEQIVAGLRKGDEFKIIRVVKDPNPEIGTRCYPFAIPLVENKGIGRKEINAQLLYRDFYDKGILNPEYAEKVVVE